MRRTLMLTFGLLSIGVFAPSSQAVVRLIGITGDLHSGEFAFENGPDDETLYEINITTAATTRLFQTSRIPDTNTIGYNPNNGLLYHLSGSESYRNDSTRWGYNDNQYMETINLDTQAMAAVFNANGPPVGTDNVPVFGLPAPRPDWVLPAERRTDQQEDPSFRQKGENEYGSARELAWSDAEDLWYLSSGDGLFKLTPEGDSTFVGEPILEPDDMKGLEFVGSKLIMGSKESGFLYELDPATGLEIGEPLPVVGPSLIPYAKILALATHPETGVLYGIVQADGAAEEDRELVTINPTTGAATQVGVLSTALDVFGNRAAFGSMAFVGFSAGVPGDKDGDGDVDGHDFLLIQRGLGGDFDAGDMAEWKANFPHPAGVAAAGAVPEPAALSLACLALGMAIAARCRVA
jgi:hypothetical protein